MKIKIVMMASVATDVFFLLVLNTMKPVHYKQKNSFLWQSSSVLGIYLFYSPSSQVPFNCKKFRIRSTSSWFFLNKPSKWGGAFMHAIDLYIKTLWHACVYFLALNSVNTDMQFDVGKEDEKNRSIFALNQTVKM